MLGLYELISLNNLSVIIVTTLVGLYLFSIKTYNFWKHKNVKFVKPVPLFGNSMKTIFRKKTLSENQEEIYYSFPEERYVGMFMFRLPVLMLRDPTLIHRIITKDFGSFSDRGIKTDERLDFLSQHLVNLNGQPWKSLRNKLAPAFSSTKLKVMSCNLNECSDSLSDNIDHSIKDNSLQEIYEIMAKYATDVIGSCAFGLQINSLKDPDSAFRKMGRDIFKPSARIILKFITRAFHPDIPYYLNLKFLRPEVEDFFLNFVKTSMSKEDNPHSDRKDFIKILSDLRKDDSAKDKTGENNFVLSDQVVASNIFAFFLGGFETISYTMSFLLLELAVHPDIQDAVRSEIVEALKTHNGELTYDSIKALSYLDMVISETLRKYPIGTVLVRECTQSYQVPDSSLTIDQGTRVIVPVFALHYDPAYFPEPERFDPQRFSPENKTKIVQGTYLPFGDGPRICIGIRFAMMEMKYAFCKIIPKYEFSLSERTQYPAGFKKGVPLLAADGGVWLNVKSRS